MFPKPRQAEVEITDFTITMTEYNEFVLIDDREGEFASGEYHVATVTDRGVYFDHIWMDGAQFVPHEQFEELNEFRKEFLEEIGGATRPGLMEEP